MKNKGKYIVLLIGAFLIGTLFTTFGQTAVQTIAGLAVAQSSTIWNNVKDAAFGDNATKGILAVNPYLYDGTNFDRARGDATNGLDVDVTRVSGNVTVVGASTPAVNFANPTTAINTWSLLGMYDGSTWDQVLESIHGDNLTTANGLNVASFNYLYDGSNQDRARSFATNVDDVTAVAVTTSGISGAVAYNYVYDGTNWDRLTTDAAVKALYLAGQSNASNNITTNTTTAIKATAGTLNRIIVNTGGTGSTVALYNIASAGCTGTPGSGFIGTLGTTVALSSIIYDHTFTLGICAVTAGAAAADISALYR